MVHARAKPVPPAGLPWSRIAGQFASLPFVLGCSERSQRNQRFGEEPYRLGRLSGASRFRIFQFAVQPARKHTPVPTLRFRRLSGTAQFRPPPPCHPPPTP